jgi:hypothetical protein
VNKFKKVKEVIASVEADVAKFHDGGNGAAGTGVRGCCTTENLRHTTTTQNGDTGTQQARQ